jgi:uncharacterized protein YbjQ (UPF0145 family)
MTGRSFDPIVTTTFEVPGYRIVRWLGIVRGITVRTRGVGGRFLASISSLVGGKVQAYVSMCEVARAEALEYMLEHAREKGANAVVGMRYDATEVEQAMTEVLAYGTAVVIEPLGRE